MEESLHYFSKTIHTYCYKCGDKAWLDNDHSLHEPTSGVDYISIDGIFIAKEIINEEEEKYLIDLIDSRQEWRPSQEGRAKQDYGPKVNFMQQRVSIGDFKGFPDFVVKLFDSLKERYPSQLFNFIPVEFCFLEYTPERGSYIRPHYDDKWIWGNRLITVNLLSETFLRLTREFNSPPSEIVVSMPPRSLLIIQDEARYNWLHSINKYDIKSRRIALTWREFGDEILNESQHANFITNILEISKKVIV